MVHRRSAIIAGAFSALVALVAPQGAAFAQSYPKGNVTIVVPFAAGGPTDTIARIYSEPVAKSLGVTAIVENVAGAGGSTGAARVAKAAPDGLTLLVHNVAPLVAAPALYPSATFDPVDGFVPIASLGEAAIHIVVRKDFPAQNLQELIAYAKANPEKVNFATAGAGSATHLACVMLEQAAGIKLTHIPYRGTGPAVNDLVSGKVDMMCDQALNMIQHVRAGSIRDLAIAQEKRSEAVPDVPTSAEAGLAGYVVSSTTALYAPKGLAADHLAALAKAVQDAAAGSFVKERIAALASDMPSAERQTPAGLKAFTTSEAARWQGLVKAVGLKVN